MSWPWVILVRNTLSHHRRHHESKRTFAVNLWVMGFAERGIFYWPSLCSVSFDIVRHPLNRKQNRPWQYRYLSDGICKSTFLTMRITWPWYTLWKVSHWAIDRCVASCKKEGTNPNRRESLLCIGAKRMSWERAATAQISATLPQIINTQRHQNLCFHNMCVNHFSPVAVIQTQPLRPIWGLSAGDVMTTRH